MYIPRSVESNLQKPDHKYNIGDIIRSSDSYIGECHWIVEGIRYDPVWYVWQYEYRILENNVTSRGDIQQMDADDRYLKVA